MQELHSLDYSTLVDLLSTYTAKYTQMIANHEMNSEEFYTCKFMVKCIQEEIEARDKSSQHSKSNKEKP